MLTVKIIRDCEAEPLLPNCREARKFRKGTVLMYLGHMPGWRILVRVPAGEASYYIDPRATEELSDSASPPWKRRADRAGGEQL